MGAKNLTKEEFIKKANSIPKHKGKNYNYEKVNYINYTTQVEIICGVCNNIFYQTPSIHLRGSGCTFCNCNNKKSNTEEFIKKSLLVDNHKNYNYDKVRYVNAFTDVEIICPIHGSFFQRPSNHLNGGGCDKCSRDSLRSNVEEFVKKSLLVPEHRDKKYNYNKVKYINNHTPVEIICPIHGSFFPTPKNHLHGTGCPDCVAYTIKDFIKKALTLPQHQGRNYNYDKVKYTNSYTKIEIVCPIHGSFYIKPYQHLKTNAKGTGCPDCGHGNLRSNTKEFIEKALLVPEHYDKNYNYSKVKYITSGKNITIICPKHGSFSQRPSSHLAGVGCPFCVSSKGETKIIKILDKNKIKYKHQKSFKNLKSPKNGSLFYDFYIPSQNILIEYDGRQHESFKNYKYFLSINNKSLSDYKLRKQFKYRQLLDQLKDFYAKAHNITLIRIKYNEDIAEKLKLFKVC